MLLTISLSVNASVSLLWKVTCTTVDCSCTGEIRTMLLTKSLSVNASVSMLWKLTCRQQSTCLTDYLKQVLDFIARNLPGLGDCINIDEVVEN